jgi:hypothetical protein
MQNEERGKIRNREIAKQLRDYSGLRFGKITPTDIDGFLDFGDKLFIFIETKYGSATLSYGQGLAFKRLCDACANAKRESILIIARHNTSKENDVDVSKAIVTFIRHNKQWKKQPENKTVRQMIDDIIKWKQINI